MSNLISDTAKDIFTKIQLFADYDPTQYQDDPQYSWISSATLTNYHNDNTERLESEYDEIVGDLAAIDENDTESIQLGSTDDDFVMKPENIDDYLAQGLTFEAEATDALFGKYTFTDIDMTVIDGGNTLEFSFDVTVENTGIHPYPFESMTLNIVINLEYWTTNLYRNGTIPATITILNMYRGPADNIDDRGQNYYAPIDIVASSISGLDATNYFRRSGTIWDFDTMTFDVTTTFDNGSTATMELHVPFTVDFNAGKITADADVESNGTYLDFQGSITMPVGQWSEFTSTQSPNILTAINELFSTSTDPKTLMYSAAIIDSVTEIWPTTIDALPYGEFLDMDNVLQGVQADLAESQSVASVEYQNSVKKHAKTFFANQVFIEGANYALNELGINTEATIGMTQPQLSDLNDELIAAGVTDFEEEDGYYNWANIPQCNSLDECSRYATAVFEEVLDFDEMMDHPALNWLRNNYDYITAEVLTAKNEIAKVI